jgi:YD repeat-containing protein
VSFNQNTQYSYDDLNRLTAVTYGTGSKIVYTYDPAGNCTSVAIEHTGFIAPSVERICPTCRRAVPAGKKFCTFDGTRIPDISPVTPVERICPMCQQVVPAGKKFCTFDGTRVPDMSGILIPPVTPVERICPTCQRVVPVGKKFCTFDGTRVP